MNAIPFDWMLTSYLLINDAIKSKGTMRVAGSGVRLAETGGASLMASIFCLHYLALVACFFLFANHFALTFLSCLLGLGEFPRATGRPTHSCPVCTPLYQTRIIFVKKNMSGGVDLQI